jgi:hypothetical protein
MKALTITILLFSLTFTKGVRNPAETAGAMNGMVLDIDWSGLVNQMQPPAQQPEYGVMTAPAPIPVPVAPVAPVAVAPVPVAPVVAAPEFMEINAAAQLNIPNVNSVADLISRSWANTWHMIARDKTSSINLIYAAYKPLDGVEGVHWRLVFKLVGAGNTEYIALDVAVLANGMVDVFRNLQTRNLTDVSVLFGVSISGDNMISMEYLKESFLHNSIMIINPNYNAAQANQTGFSIEWTHIQEVAPQQANLNVVLNNIGGQQQPEYGVMETNVDIGNANTSSDYDMY